MALDNYDPSTALSAYYPTRDERRPARLWATEKLLHDMAELGMVEFFEGAGTDPTGISGYAVTKLWLRVSSGVTEAPGEVRAYDGSGDATLLASWPELTRGAFLEFLGVSPALGRFETRLDLQAATIAPSVNGVMTLGYASAGDGGGAHYRRVGSEPTHAGKVQSDDGAWWEIAAGQTLTPVMFGAATNGTSDSTTAVANAFALAKARGQRTIDGCGLKYRVTNASDLGNNYGVHLENGYLLEAVTGGDVQLNTYADRHQRFFGREYLWALYNWIKVTSNPIDVYCYGDSTMQAPSGWPSDGTPWEAFVQSMWPRLARHKGLKQRLELTNRGVGGTVVSDIDFEDDLATDTSTVTISNASPAVVTWTGHGLPAGKKIRFTTDGALPAGLTVGKTYYVKTVLTANTFTVSDEPDGTVINTSDAGSGTHTANAIGMQLMVLKYGINDATVDSDPDVALSTFATNLEAALTAVRNHANGDIYQLSILLVGASTTYAPSSNRDASWFERLRGIYEAAARKHRCAYFDTYGYMQDSRWAVGAWLDDSGLHPEAVGYWWIWGPLFDLVFPDNALEYWRRNLVWNNSAIVRAADADWTVNTEYYPYGISLDLALITQGWPVNGGLMTLTQADRPSLQSVWQQNGIPRVMHRVADINTNIYGTVWAGVPIPFHDTLANGWAIFDTTYYGYPEVIRSVSGTCTIHAVLAPGTTTADTVIATLPTGYRPRRQMRIACPDIGGAMTVLEIAQTGQIVIKSGTPSSMLNIDVTYIAQTS